MPPTNPWPVIARHPDEETPVHPRCIAVDGAVVHHMCGRLSVPQERASPGAGPGSGPAPPSGRPLRPAPHPGRGPRIAASEPAKPIRTPASSQLPTCPPAAARIHSHLHRPRAAPAVPPPPFQPPEDGRFPRHRPASTMANAYRAYSDAASFLAAASPALLASPLFNQLPLALPTLSSSDPVRFPDVRLRTLHAPDGALRGAVVHTPPYAANLSLMAAEDAREMGRAYAAEFALPAGFSCVGEDAAARAFADGALDALQAMGRTARVEAEDRQGLWKLTAVAPPAPPPALGKMRPATADDAELLQRWLEAFTAEAVPHDPPPAPGRGAALAARGGARLWVLPDGTPVCFATFGRDVAGWVSVGPVYTPRERRGRGYAGALVAEMGREALKQGRPGCTLFTDLANPTSNGVYKRVGYEMVGTLTRFKVAVEDGKAEA